MTTSDPGPDFDPFIGMTAEAIEELPVEEWTLRAFGYAALLDRPIGEQPPGTPVLGRNFMALYVSQEARLHTLDALGELQFATSSLSAGARESLIGPYRPIIEGRLGPRPQIGTDD